MSRIRRNFYSDQTLPFSCDVLNCNFCDFPHFLFRTSTNLRSRNEGERDRRDQGSNRTTIDQIHIYCNQQLSKKGRCFTTRNLSQNIYVITCYVIRTGLHGKHSLNRIIGLIISHGLGNGIYGKTNYSDIQDKIVMKE